MNGRIAYTSKEGFSVDFTDGATAADAAAIEQIFAGGSAEAVVTASRFSSDVRRFKATYFNYVGKALTYILATPETELDAQNSLRLSFGNEASHRDIDEFSRGRIDASVAELVEERDAVTELKLI